MSLPIPLVALADCGAILGRRGAGKSATRTLFLEHELDAGHRCVLIDPKGDSWGIRLNPDGSPSRFSIPIFGGHHADYPIQDTAGAALGQMIAAHDISCIIDLSGFSTAGMRRFMRDFAEALFTHNRAALTLFVDEADQLAPQTVPAEMARLLHEMERLVRQGRQRGIFMWMLTQRPQVLNKNLLSQAETLIAMRMTTPHDREAVARWMEAHDATKAKEVLATLAGLAVGEAWAWVPAADYLERVQFPLFSTYDSGRTPKHGETVAGVVLPPLDSAALAGLLAHMEAGPAVEPGGDSQLSARIGQLQADLVKVKAERDAALAEACRHEAAAKAYRSAFDAYLAAISVINHPAADGTQVSAPSGATIRSAKDAERGAVSRTQPVPEAAPHVANPSPSLSPPGAERLFRAIARAHPMPLTIKQVAGAARVSMQSSAWRHNRGALLASGLVEEVAGRWKLTAAGVAAMPVAPPLTWADIVASLTPSAAGCLNALAQADAPLSRDVIASRAGISLTSSGLGSTLRALVAADLIKPSGRDFVITSEMAALHRGAM